MEKAECEKKAQLAYSFDIALQNEFSMQENIALARQFLLENFVSRGMVVDFVVHSLDKEDVGISNPHFHVMCPIRPLDEHGRWGNEQRREYVLDEHGERILDEVGNYVFNAVPTTDWGSPETLERKIGNTWYTIETVCDGTEPLAAKVKRLIFLTGRWRVNGSDTKLW